MKRARKTGKESMSNCLYVIRSTGADVELWLTQHLGNLLDERDELKAEIGRLKRRLTRLEAKTTHNP
jgi:hypothetical protein